VGDTLVAEARLLHTTKRTGVYRMDVFRNDELIATFNGTVFRKV
jgi:acyl-coenzyme A thioesterase PaaI-like protein